MENRTFFAVALAICGTLAAASASYATFVVPGSYQSEALFGGDWSPESAPPMVETPAGSGKFTMQASTFLPVTRFFFKILDDQNAPPAAWGDPEITPIDTWFVTDGAGDTSVTLDRNTYSDGFQPATNRLIVSSDASIPGIFATGNWMNEAGGAGDWNAADATFQMTNQGGGLFTATATISTPGSYEWKATAGDFDAQWGANGRSKNPSSWAFNTFQNNQQVTFKLDVVKGAISYSTIAVLAGDTDNNGIVQIQDFNPIRDNFLEMTTLRSDGDLTLDGIVDVLDFHEWKTAFTVAGGSAELIAEAFASLPIPEPSVAALAIAAGLGLVARARRRN